MANLFEKRDRHLIPNWRSFDNTATLGELNGSKSIKLDSSFKPDITDLIDDWEKEQTIGVAGDVLSVALVCNQENDFRVQQIAIFVLENQHLSSKAMINAAKAVLRPKNDTIVLHQDIRPETFNDYNLSELYFKVNSLKKKLILNPSNAITWVELSRYYSMIGQSVQAKRSMLNAIYLAPQNRFILRSAARFFVHLGDFEFAHDLIRKTDLVRYDPWVMATEIALSSLRGRYSKFIKPGMQIIESGTFHPFNVTELSSSLASVELENNRIKKSRQLFEKSLTNPNDNSLAQAEWASQKDKSVVLVDQKHFDIKNSFEAVARDLDEKKKWAEAVDFSKQWFFDMPFSKMSIMFGAEIASSKMKDYRLAVDIGRLGLISHPNDGTLLNNIIYSLARENELDEATKYIQLIKREDLNNVETVGICLTATRGLIEYRKGNFEAGRTLYFEAMLKSKNQKNVFLNSLALINLLREEMRIGNNDITDFLPRLRTISKKWKDEPISEDALSLIDDYNRIKNSLMSDVKDVRFTSELLDL